MQKATNSDTLSRHLKGYLGGGVMAGLIFLAVHLIIQEENARRAMGLVIQGSKWQVSYFENEEFKNKPIATESVDKIAFKWEGKSPAEGVFGGRFGARYDTCITADEKQKIYFKTSFDDGLRVYIDGEKIFESWQIQVKENEFFRHRFSKGKHHLRLEYYQGSGSSFFKLQLGHHKSKLVDLPIDKSISIPKNFDSDSPCD